MMAKRRQAMVVAAVPAPACKISSKGEIPEFQYIGINAPISHTRGMWFASKPTVRLQIIPHTNIGRRRTTACIAV